MNQLATFITTILALSVAAERIVEVLKGFIPHWPFVAATPDPPVNPQANPPVPAPPNTAATAAAEGRRCAVIHCIAGACGGVAALCSKVDLINFQHAYIGPFPAVNRHTVASFVMAALLTSFGSAFWNHALDLLQATKVQAEQAAAQP